MLDAKTPDKIIFLDIETVPQYPSYAEMPERFQELFRKRFKTQIADETLKGKRTDTSLSNSTDPKHTSIVADAGLDPAFMEKLYIDKASLFPEWGRIVCISIGTIKRADGLENVYPIKAEEDLSFTVHSFADENEVKLIEDFMRRTNSVNSKLMPDHFYCAHAGKLFDYPFIAKRIILNQLQLPKLFDYSDKKPWEVPHFIDTNEVYKHGSFDGGIGLDLLTAIFDIPSPKQDIDGSMVREVYYKEKDLPRIQTYCEADVFALAQVYLKLKGMKNKITLNPKTK